MDQNIILNLATGLIPFLLAIVVHEYSHARMAKFFGDTTSERLGRLTLNPAVHIDPIGTILFPLIGVFTGGVMFGWAKPVPYDTRYFKNINKGIFWVSFAGPLSNIIQAVFYTFFTVIISIYLPDSIEYKTIILIILQKGSTINLVLAVFNMIPLPPLDGAKMVSSQLNYSQSRKFEELGRYSFVFFLLLWLTNIFYYLMLPATIFNNFLINIFFAIFS